MSAFRRFLAFASLVVGALILMYSLSQPERPFVGVLLGALLMSNGLLRLYVGAGG